jgi:hypothetical protein
MGGGKPGKSSGSLPYWMQGMHKALSTKATEFAFGDEGAYQQYDGPQIAGLTDQENQANIAREEMFNRGDVMGQFAADQYTAAAGLNDQVEGIAMSEFNEEEYQKRRNPYIDNVVNKNVREADDSFSRRLNQDQASSIARGGSVGSYRVGLENAFLEGERAQTLGDIRNQGELDAYNQSLSSFERDRDTKLGGLGQGVEGYNQIGAQANQLGSDNMAREYQMINELDRSGAIQREMRQNEMNLAKQEFDDKNNWPKQQMSWLSSIYSGMPAAQMGSTTFSNPTAGAASQAASLGLTAAAFSQYT